MNWKGRIWKFATVILVVIILLNPEWIEFALFIDAVGLEMFLLLLEIQLAAIITLFFNTRIKPLLVIVKRLGSHSRPELSWRIVKEEPGLLAYTLPAPATLMHLLVFSAAIGIAVNALS